MTFRPRKTISKRSPCRRTPELQNILNAWKCVAAGQDASRNKSQKEQKRQKFQSDLKIKLYSLRNSNLGYLSQVTSVQKLPLEEMILLHSTWTSPGNLKIVHKIELSKILSTTIPWTSTAKLLWLFSHLPNYPQHIISFDNSSLAATQNRWLHLETRSWLWAMQCNDGKGSPQGKEANGTARSCKSHTSWCPRIAYTILFHLHFYWYYGVMGAMYSRKGDEWRISISSMWSRETTSFLVLVNYAATSWIHDKKPPFVHNVERNAWCMTRIPPLPFWP